MPAKQTISNETKDEIMELWSIGREHYKPGEKQHGYYTLKDIEEITGVNHKTAWMIAKGER